MGERFCTPDGSAGKWEGSWLPGALPGLVSHLGALSVSAAAGLSVAVFLLAAKSHGRQLRLERELEGYHEVVFGGTNPRFVEALWQEDRAVYWMLFPIAAGVPGLTFMAASVLGWLRSLTYPAILLILLGILLWAFIVSFFGCGMLSIRRFARALRDGSVGGETRESRARRERPDWLAQARRGTAAFWVTTVALALAVPVLLIL